MRGMTATAHALHHHRLLDHIWLRLTALHISYIIIIIKFETPTYITYLDVCILGFWVVRNTQYEHSVFHSLHATFLRLQEMGKSQRSINSLTFVDSMK